MLDNSSIYHISRAWEPKSYKYRGLTYLLWAVYLRYMNTKNIISTIIILAVIAGGIYYYQDKKSAVISPKNSTFTINGQEIALKNGMSEMESAPGSASKIITTYFGNEATGDFNNDGNMDTAFLVTQTAGGSGTFFYLATTLGGPTMFLGDRIAPQSTNLINGQIVVTYADRKEGEPMSANPSVGMSKNFEVINGALTETQPK